MSQKAAEQSAILIQLGQVLAPLHQLASKVPVPSATEFRVAIARFEHDLPRWEESLHAFAQIGGVMFNQQHQATFNRCREFHSMLRRQSDVSDVAQMQENVTTGLKSLQVDIPRLLSEFPIDWEPRLTAAKTPFTASLLIGDAIRTAQRRLDYFDRYLDPDFFPLYLRNVSSSVAVVLVTTAKGINAVRAHAKLAAAEFASFSLVECSPADFHDRNLRIDDTIFHLGPSTGSAGDYPTNFGPGDSTAHGHQVLDKLIAAGTIVTP